MSTSITTTTSGAVPPVSARNYSAFSTFTEQQDFVSLNWRCILPFYLLFIIVVLTSFKLIGKGVRPELRNNIEIRNQMKWYISIMSLVLLRQFLFNIEFNMPQISGLCFGSVLTNPYCKIFITESLEYLIFWTLEVKLINETNLEEFSVPLFPDLKILKIRHFYFFIAKVLNPVWILAFQVYDLSCSSSTSLQIYTFIKTIGQAVQSLVTEYVQGSMSPVLSSSWAQVPKEEVPWKPDFLYSSEAAIFSSLFLRHCCACVFRFSFDSFNSNSLYKEDPEWDEVPEWDEDPEWNEDLEDDEPETYLVELYDTAYYKCVLCAAVGYLYFFVWPFVSGILGHVFEFLVPNLTVWELHKSDEIVEVFVFGLFLLAMLALDIFRGCRRDHRFLQRSVSLIKDIN
ncbi:hypothetical protein WICPIJ_007001 [Wickerhamomyces pijperi]|uniref:Uncharacterized protein n=1 Tax=Wickerhamomyces pijperi TaxID=599730 RepID=A0A9P8TKC6_WICPI|nr:hypothetical protein WICPIJ_007001 [Wickerhamomyces pijperi]